LDGGDHTYASIISLKPIVKLQNLTAFAIQHKRAITDFIEFIHTPNLRHMLLNGWCHEVPRGL
jgi:hypothetical protein